MATTETDTGTQNVTCTGGGDGKIGTLCTAGGSRRRGSYCGKQDGDASNN